MSRKTLKVVGLIALNTMLLLLAIEGGLRLMGVGHLYMTGAAASAGHFPREIVAVNPPAFLTNHLGILVGNPQYPGLNSDGFRTPEFSERAHGRKSVLLLGDSFTWGYSAMPVSRCFADRIREAGYRVYNLGIPSVGTEQYAALAEHYVPMLRPDVVYVMLYAGNDITSEPPVRTGYPRRYWTNAGLLPAHDDAWRTLSFDEAVRAFQAVHGDTLFARANRLLRGTATGTLVRVLAGQLPQADNQTANIRAAIGRIAAACEAGKVPWKILVIPAHKAAYNGSDLVDYAVETLAGFPIEPLGAFESGDYFSLADEHLNNAGHERAAGYLLGALRTAGLAPLPVTRDSLETTDPAALVTLAEAAALLGLNETRTARVRQEIEQLKLRVFEARVLAAPGTDITGQIEPMRRACVEMIRPVAGEGWAFAQPDRLFTGSTVFGDNLLGAASAVARARLAPARDPSGNVTLEGLAALLQVDQAVQDEMRRLLDAHAREQAGLLQRPAEGGQPAPLKFLAAEMAKRGPNNTQGALLGEYMGAHRPEGESRNYIALRIEIESGYRDQLLALLPPADQALLDPGVISSLTDIQTGYDPVGKALEAELYGAKP